MVSEEAFLVPLSTREDRDDEGERARYGVEDCENAACSGKAKTSSERTVVEGDICPGVGRYVVKSSGRIGSSIDHQRSGCHRRGRSLGSSPLLEVRSLLPDRSSDLSRCLCVAGIVMIESVKNIL